MTLYAGMEPASAGGAKTYPRSRGRQGQGLRRAPRPLTASSRGRTVELRPADADDLGLDKRLHRRIWVRVYEAASYEDLFFSVSMDRRVG